MRLRSSFAAAALVAALLVASAPVGGASHPGKNGLIAFRRNPGSTLWVVSPDGSDERQIPGVQNATYPSFSPDGREIAYRAGDSFSRGSIAAVGVEGEGLRTIVPEDDGGQILGGPAWSPDGTRLAFTFVDSDDFVARIRVVDASTGATLATLQSPETVTLNDERTYRGSLFTPSWSPADDRKLVVQHNRPFENDDGWGDVEIASITLDGSLTNLTDDTRIDGAPDWSPDGTRIAYVSLDDPEGSAGVIRTVGAGGGSPTQVTAAARNFKDLAFSPDGTKLVLDDGGNLYTIASGVAMGTPSILPGAGGDRNEPAWGPGGAPILLSGTITTTNCSDTACVPEPLAGAVVTASGPDTGEGVTGPDGQYAIELDEAGVYSVTPSMPGQPGQGFRPASKSLYLKADKTGVDFVTCSAGATSEGEQRISAAVDEARCYSILVEDLNATEHGSNYGSGSLGDFAEIDVPPVNLRLDGVGWNPAGGPIALYWQGRKVKTFPAAATFRTKIVAEHWPQRARYGTDRAVCGGKVAGRQGDVTRTVTVLAGAGAVVLFADLDPVFRTGDYVCVGEYQTVLKKTPGTVITSDLRGDRMIVSRNGRNTPELVPGRGLCVELTNGRGHVTVKRVDGFLEVSGRKAGRCK